MFHGPVGEALPFFAQLGFACPVRKDPASFLQEVTTPKGAPLPGLPHLLVSLCIGPQAQGVLTPGPLFLAPLVESPHGMRHTLRCFRRPQCRCSFRNGQGWGVFVSPSASAQLMHQTGGTKQSLRCCHVPVTHAARVRAGQLLFASEELRRECGIRGPGDEAAYTERLLVDTEDISAAFWGTKWGAAMRDELDHAPFNPCAPPPKPLSAPLTGSERHRCRRCPLQLH